MRSARRDDAARARWNGLRACVVEGLEARYIGVAAIRPHEPIGPNAERETVVVKRRERVRGLAIGAVALACTGYAAMTAIAAVTLARAGYAAAHEIVRPKAHEQSALVKAESEGER